LSVAKIVVQPVIMNLNKTVLTLICLATLITILVAGLWPFDFSPENKVFWLKDEPGVRITGPGHLYSPVGLEHFFTGKSISLEIRLRPATDQTRRYCNILSFWSGARQEVFLIGQHRDELYLRIPGRRPGMTRDYLEVGRERLLEKGRAVFITLTSNHWGTVLYEDGRRTASYPNFQLLKESGAESGRLILGNSADGRHWWEGDILGLAIYDRVKSDQEVQQNYLSWVRRDYQGLKTSNGLAAFYPFTEGRGEYARNQAGDAFPLYKPPVFQPLRKVVLAWPSKQYLKRFAFYQDAAVNLFGFIPFGFFVALRLLRFTRLPATESIVLTVVLGGLVSLGIELAQVYLPGRNSEAGDVVFNVIGTLIGVAIIRYLIKKELKGFESIPHK
jgi:VanZ family protein